MKRLSIKQQANRIQKILDQATVGERSEGMRWYQDAHDFAATVADEYGLSVREVSQLISLLSPQKKWEQNKADVIKFLDGETDGIFSTKRTLDECERVVTEGFNIPESRLKTFAFAKCIEEAYDNETDPVVIDRHAIKIAFGQMKADAIIITDRRYKDAAEAYRIVAEKNGMRAHELQAVTWLTYKRIVKR